MSNVVIDEEELWDKSGRYKRYWEHHKVVSSWIKDYIKEYKEEQCYYDNQMYQTMQHYGNAYQPVNDEWKKHHSAHSNTSHVNYHPWYQSEFNVSKNTDDMNFDLADSEDSFEMEISDELRHFFAVSAKFREERKKAREAEELDDTSAHTGSKLKRSTSAPSERPGQRRIKEMQELYGKNAAMIHGMETALQLQFDRGCDKKQPSYWPIIPLNT